MFRYKLLTNISTFFVNARKKRCSCQKLFEHYDSFNKYELSYLSLDQSSVCTVVITERIQNTNLSRARIQIMSLLSSSRSLGHRLRNLAVSTNRCLSAEDNPTPVTADKSDSFLFGIFNGKINKDHIFPYPNVFDRESVDELQTFYSSAETAFFEENTPLENDLNGFVKPEHLQLIKDFGMMGMQVPEEYEGLELNNTQFARMSEIGGRNDLGTSIVIGAHQSIGFKAILIQGHKGPKRSLPGRCGKRAKNCRLCFDWTNHGIPRRFGSENQGRAPGRWFFYHERKQNLDLKRRLGRNIHRLCPSANETRGRIGQEQNDGIHCWEELWGRNQRPSGKKMGIKASNTAEVYFDDVPIPAENVIGEIGEGFKVSEIFEKFSELREEKFFVIEQTHA